MSVQEETWDHVKRIFSEAIALPADQREAFLRRACGDDEPLRNQVEALLRSHQEAGGFLGAPTLSEQARNGSDESHDPPAGELIGPYKLLQLIGEGGFGSVYMAEQQTPVVRRVALKIIKLGMDTRQVIARFEAERQALAMMDHPNIARVLDAGATSEGRPYFAMELVKGEPVTDYCDRNNLTIAQRLDLFVQVCQAVQHAHQKGIIHRDLKPTNILVSTQDGRPFAKVIDFGIAKATAARLTEKTLFTEHKALIGTPEYMSPEQAEGSLDIDTRTDVYSLGVLLYELLTGSTPFDRKSLRSAAYAEIQRIIREVEPPKPSTRLSNLSSSPLGRGARVSEGDSPRRGEGESTLAQVAAHRGMEPGRLGSLVRGDLDWIVMKSLEKDRQRRYGTAHDLAEDVQRHLTGDAVVAAPPSKVYRMRKFVLRHRAGTAAGALVSLAILLGLAGTSWGILWALDERDRAQEETSRADREAKEAKHQTAVAETRAEETQQVADFQAAMLSEIDADAMGRGIKEALREHVRTGLERRYVGQFPDRRPRTPQEVAAALAAFDEGVEGAHAMDVARRVMDEFVFTPAAAALEERFADQPLVRAQLHSAIGNAYRQLGVAGSEPHLRAALEIRRRELGLEHELVGDSAWKLAVALGSPDRCAEALPLMREAIDIHLKTCPNECETLADGLFNMAHMTEFAGELAEAERFSRESLAMRRRVVGSKHPMVANGMNALARVLSKRGLRDEADSLNREALAIARAAHGDEDPMNARILNDLGVSSIARGDAAAAEPFLREAVAIERTLGGDGDVLLPTMVRNLARALERKGDKTSAERVYSESLALRRAIDGNENPEIAMNQVSLAGLLREKRDYGGAELLLREALATQREYLSARPSPEQELPQAPPLMELGRVFADQGKLAEAETVLRECLTIREKALKLDSSDYWLLVSTRSMLGGALAGQGAGLIESEAPAAITRFTEAEPLLVESTAWLRENAERIPEQFRAAQLREALERIVMLYEVWGKPELAEEWRQRGD